MLAASRSLELRQRRLRVYGFRAFECLSIMMKVFRIFLSSGTSAFLLPAASFAGEFDEEEGEYDG